MSSTSSLVTSSLRRGLTLHPQDKAAMVNHAIPSAGLYTVVGGSFILTAPLMYLLAGQLAAFGQEKLMKATDKAIDWCEYVADAVNSDGTLREDAPFTVVMRKFKQGNGSTAGAEERAESSPPPTEESLPAPSAAGDHADIASPYSDGGGPINSQKKDRSKKNQQQKKQGPTSSSAPSATSADSTGTTTSPKDVSNANAGTANINAAPFSKRRAAAAQATNAAYNWLEDLRTLVHEAGTRERQRGQLRRLLGSAVLRLWLKIARLFAVKALEKAFRVLAAYFVCGLLDTLRAKTILGRVLFLNNIVGTEGYSAASTVAVGDASPSSSKPFLISNSFRYVCMAFLSESSAVMGMFANVSERIPIASASIASHTGTLNKLLSKYAFFYDAAQQQHQQQHDLSTMAAAADPSSSSSAQFLPIRFKSSLHALFTLACFQHLPFVFGYRHLTGIGPLESTMKKEVLTQLGPTELTYWLFLKDLMRATHEAVWSVGELSRRGDLSSRTHSNKNHNGLTSTVIGNVPSSLNYAFNRYLISIAKGHGYRTEAEQKAAVAAFEEAMGKEDRAMAAAMEAEAHAVAVEVLRRQEEEKGAAGNGGGKRQQRGKKSAACSSSKVEEVDDDDTNAEEKSERGVDDVVKVTLPQSTVDAIESDFADRKAKLKALFVAGELMRPRTVAGGLRKAGLYYIYRYASEFFVLAFAVRVLKGIVDTKTGKAVPPSAVSLSSSSQYYQSRLVALVHRLFLALVQRPAALLHNLLASTLFDGKKGTAFLWHASVVPIMHMLGPKVFRAVLVAVVKAKLRRAESIKGKVAQSNSEK